MKKLTEWQKCTLCLYGNAFTIEIIHDETADTYYYSEVCPRCKHVEEFKEITRREATKYLVLEDMP